MNVSKMYEACLQAEVKHFHCLLSISWEKPNINCTHWTKMHGPQFTDNQNSSKRFAACHHKKKWFEWKL